jgi:hypothetical protein
VTKAVVRARLQRTVTCSPLRKERVGGLAEPRDRRATPRRLAIDGLIALLGLDLGERSQVPGAAGQKAEASLSCTRWRPRKGLVRSRLAYDQRSAERQTVPALSVSLARSAA